MAQEGKGAESPRVTEARIRISIATKDIILANRDHYAGISDDQYLAALSEGVAVFIENEEILEAEGVPEEGLHPDGNELMVVWAAQKKIAELKAK